MKRFFRRPSPAMVIAVVALIAALGGTAIAGGFITKKKAKKVADNQITKRAPGLSVASAKTADSANNANAPFAYARFNANGTVSTGTANRNLPDASNPSAGIYCLDLSFTPVHVQATGQAQGGGDDIAMVEMAPNSLTPCPAGTEIQYRNYDVSTGAQQNDVVYVEVWK